MRRWGGRWPARASWLRPRCSWGGRWSWSGSTAWSVQRAFALLLLAPVRRGRGDLAGARALVEQARELIERFTDPGVAARAAGADRASAGLAAAPASRGGGAPDRAGAGGPAAAPRPAVDPGDRPRAVGLGQHRQKPGPGHLPQAPARTRAEAVAHARELGLLPGGRRPRTRRRRAPEASSRGDEDHPASAPLPQQLARTLRVAGNLTITLSVIGPAASVFAIGSVALRQQGSGAFLAFLIAARDQRLPGGGLGRAGRAVPDRRWPVRDRRPGPRPPGRASWRWSCSWPCSSSSPARSRWPPASTWPPSGRPSTPGRPRWSCWPSPRRWRWSGSGSTPPWPPPSSPWSWRSSWSCRPLASPTPTGRWPARCWTHACYAADGGAAPVSLRTLLAGVVLGLGAYRRLRRRGHLLRGDPGPAPRHRPRDAGRARRGGRRRAAGDHRRAAGCAVAGRS